MFLGDQTKKSDIRANIFIHNSIQTNQEKPLSLHIEFTALLKAVNGDQQVNSVQKNVDGDKLVSSISRNSIIRPSVGLLSYST